MSLVTCIVYQLTFLLNCCLLIDFVQAQMRIIAFPELHSLHFSESTVHAAWIPIVLSVVRSPHLAYLKFQIIAKNTLELETFPWGIINEILNSPSFKKLSCCYVSLTIINPNGYKSDDIVQRKLPGCHSRGILRVD